MLLHVGDVQLHHNFASQRWFQIQVEAEF